MSRTPLVVLSLSVLATVAQAQRFGRDSDLEPQKLENFTFERGTFKSDKARTGEPGYAIYLPKGYADAANKDVKYPWIVWLHGFGGAGEFQGGGGAQVLDKLRGENKIPALAMIVFRAPSGRTTYLNGEASGDVEDLIVVDLLKTLQEKYRLRSERGQRALMGVSMGGMGALKIALHHPDVFGTVAVHSAAILPADPAELPTRYARQAEMMIQRGGLGQVFGDPIDRVKWAHEMPLGLVAAMKPEELKGLHVYFDAGTEDRYGFAEPNQALDKAMTEKGMRHLFRLVEGGGHAWSSPKMKESLQQSLQFVGDVFAGKDPEAAAAKDAGAKTGEKKAEAAGAGKGK